MKRQMVCVCLMGLLAVTAGCGDDGAVMAGDSEQPMAGSDGQAGDGGAAESGEPGDGDGAASSGDEAAEGGDGDGIELPDTLVPELKMLEVPEGGRAMFTDPVNVEPGDDITLCTYVEGTTDAVSYVHDFYGTQSKYGHHVVLYYATDPEEPGTRDCGNMEKYQRVLGGSGGETATMSQLPGHVASEVPAGAQFVINHHWIHYGEKPMDVQAMVVVERPDTDNAEELVIARPMAIVSLGWELPPGQEHTATVECTFEEDVEVLSSLGHEHEWGTWVKAEKISEDGESEVIFDHEFLPEMANNAKIFYYPLEDPLVFRKGDTLRFTCDWMNDTAAPLMFPREMCVFAADVISEKEMTCVNGNWIQR